jgi:hypothetical protein
MYCYSLRYKLKICTFTDIYTEHADTTPHRAYPSALSSLFNVSYFSSPQSFAKQLNSIHHALLFVGSQCFGHRWLSVGTFFSRRTTLFNKLISFDRGLGAITVEKFASEGSNVAINYMSSKEDADKLASDIATKYGVKTVVVQGVRHSIPYIQLSH